MKARAIRRAALAFCLEAQLITALLALFGYLPASFTAMFGSALLMALLFMLGGWLYYGGGGSVGLHLLLYPLVAAVGIASYMAFDSWVAALALTGVFYWRVHHNVTIRLYHYDMLNRFILTLVIIVTHLLYIVIVLSLYEAAPPDHRPLFGMLCVLLASYVIVSWGEYLTREKPASVTLPTSVVAGFSSQLLQAKAALVGGYAAAGALCLGLLFLIWNVVKQPLSALLLFLAGPLLKLIEALIGKLEAAVRRNPQLQNTGKDGEAEQMVGPLVDNGDSLATLLKPYLIAGIIILFVAWLGWKIWKVRYRRTAGNDLGEHQAASVSISAVDAKSSRGIGIKERFRSMLEDWFVPKNDPARYLYYQFLKYMATQGVAMRKDETSQEFMHRVASVWTDETRLSLVKQITSYYERHRYDRSALTAEEVTQLEGCFQQLRKASIQS